jgi:hypothetical protein
VRRFNGAGMEQYIYEKLFMDVDSLTHKYFSTNAHLSVASKKSNTQEISVPKHEKLLFTFISFVQ